MSEQQHFGMFAETGYLKVELTQPKQPEPKPELEDDYSAVVQERVDGNV